jgi:hypothetical protein
MSKMRLRGGNVTERSKVNAPTSTGDTTNDRNNNLVRSMGPLINNKVVEMAGMINIDKNVSNILV